jgi:hypothetical protein
MTSSPGDLARQARLSRAAGSPGTLVVVGDVDPAPLRVAGWSLRGVLSLDPYADRLDAAAYVDPAEVCDDAVVDAVALDGAERELAVLLPQLRASGLLVLLPTADPQDVELVRAARAVPDAADACVGLLRRFEPWAVAVAAALPLAGAPPVQMTVRGWPRGRQAAAELVDLTAAWCGTVVAVVAAPAVLPAPELPGGAAVSWALLTDSGATVLVSHVGGPEQVRLSFPTARLVAGPDGVRWEGGAALAPAPVDRGGPDRPDRRAVACAAALLRAVGGGDVGTEQWPWPADLGDLLVVSRVLEALRTSAATERLVPVA